MNGEVDSVQAFRLACFLEGLQALFQACGVRFTQPANAMIDEETHFTIWKRDGGDTLHADFLSN